MSAELRNVTLAANEMAREIEDLRNQNQRLLDIALPELRRGLEAQRESKQRWRDRAVAAEARVRELERPAVEAKRNEIRSSLTELSAQAEQDRDYEGAFNVQCRLRKHEEQWATEDQETAR